MIKIIENTDYKDTFYTVQVMENDAILSSYEIRCKSTIHKKNGKLFYLLFDRNFKLISPVFDYINVYMDNLRKAEQTKEKTLFALKYLYSFLALFHVELDRMTDNDTAKFIAFLRGGVKQGVDFWLETPRERSSTSINDYLSIIRVYLKYLSLDFHPLLRSSKQHFITLSDSYNTGTFSSNGAYQYKAREVHRVNVPKHITVEEYKRIYEYLEKEGKLEYLCIVRFMFEAGLRSGEVLGLTLEDIKQEILPNGQVIGKVIIRNRVSDKKYQSAKFLLKPKSEKEYKRKDYKTETLGYSVMYFPNSLYDQLMDYIDEAHSEIIERNEQRWLNYTVADSVEEDFEEEHNFYIFLNSAGKPLSNKTLDNEVKKIFKKCGIKLNDDGGKHDGLCHRFRHGFAMYQVAYNHVKAPALKKLMRHRNINSTLIYYTPEISDIIDVDENVVKKLFELIPDFELNK